MKASRSGTRGFLFVQPASLAMEHRDNWKVTSGTLSSRLRRHSFNGRVSRHRQAQDKKCSTFRLVLAGNLSLVILDHSVDCTQAQARALPDRLGGIERIEHTLRLADSGPSVGELHYHLPGLPLRDDVQRSAASFMQRVHCVFHDLHERLQKLVGVSPNQRKLRINEGFRSNPARSPLKLQHQNATLYQHRHVYQSLLGRTLLGETEQV